MGARYLVELADVARAAGLSVVEVDGWQTRARGSGGYDGDRPWCIMWHHTASETHAENDVGYICFGCPDAPVANLYLARDGAVWVCAAGATNTNGKGAQQLMSRGVVPADEMNTHAIGIEAANSGLGEPWPQVQIDAYFTLNNALAAAYGLTPGDCCTHHQYASDRKIDPATADAVEGPWQPEAVTTSGTWSVGDVRDEAWLRSQDLPPMEEDMTAATLWRPKGYLNTFLIGAGPAINVSGATNESLVARGVPTIVDEHQQMLECVLFQSGLTVDDLIPGGG